MSDTASHENNKRRAFDAERRRNNVARILAELRELGVPESLLAPIAKEFGL